MADTLYHWTEESLQAGSVPESSRRGRSASPTPYLLASRKTANRLTWITLPFIGVVALLVILSPVVPDALEPYRPSGSIIGWTWVRGLTPFINLYAVFFLVGGAFYSAWRYMKSPGTGHGQRALGNVFIAVGGILPGIGGTMAKTGVIEALYIGEFAGLILIWFGFALNIKAPRAIASQPAMVQ